VPLKTLPKPLVFLIFGALGSLFGWVGGEGVARLVPSPVVTSGPYGPEVTLIQPDIYRRNIAAELGSSPSMLFEPEVQRRLEAAGASASGDIKLALSWGTIDDLDIHCFEPDGTHIYFSTRRSRSGGELDVDQNAGRPLRTDPIEHIFWPTSRAPEGRYKVYVHRYQDNSGDPQVPFSLFLAIGELRKEVNGFVSSGNIPNSPVLTFEYRVSDDIVPVASSASPIVGIIMVAATLGLLSVGIASSICAAQSRMLGRGSWIPARFGKVVLFGLAGGLLAGAIGQGLLSFAASNGSIGDVRLLKTIAWIVAGGALGLGFSFFIPNLERIRAIIAGVAGGLLAGIVVGAQLMPNPILSRLLACVAMGGAIGLAIAWVESLAREGFIMVHWAPGEVTTVNLGSRPVSVGTGPEATIRIPRSTGYPELVADFRIENGQATMRHHMTGATHPVRNGNKLVLGPVTLTIRLIS
jgi:hypothetical protein